MVLGGDDGCAFVQPFGAPRIAEYARCADLGRSGLRLSKTVCGPARDPCRPDGCHPRCRAGLQHEFADQNFPTDSPRGPPGQVAFGTWSGDDDFVGVEAHVPGSAVHNGPHAEYQPSKRVEMAIPKWVTSVSVAGTPQHPSQSIEYRASLAEGQRPTAVVFGCADSRVAAEIIFDQGLGTCSWCGPPVTSSTRGHGIYRVRGVGPQCAADRGSATTAAARSRATLAPPTNCRCRPDSVRDVVERITLVGPARAVTV